MLETRKISLINKTKGKLPSLPFEQIKDFVLGKDYSLSIVICGEKRIRSLNKKFRNIDKATDILSFPLSKSTGEVFICASRTKVEAKKFERSYENFFAFLVIHGFYHLKGFDHSSRMESEELKARRKFNI